MAYETFIPTVWNEHLNRELEPKLTLAKHTNRTYEGDVKQAGDSVRILNVGRPTIHEHTTDDKETLHTNLPAPEVVDNTSVTMYIKQVRDYNYYVGDIDEVQMKNDGKVFAAYQKETAIGLAEKIDKYIGQIVFPTAPIFVNNYADGTSKIIKVTAGSSKTGESAEQNVLELLDDIVQKGRENNIPDSEKIYVAVSPQFEKYIRRALLELRTDNTEVIEGKEYLKYYNLRIEWTNYLKKIEAAGGKPAHEYITARTDRAVAFARPFTHSEAYRPEKGFADAIKGFTLFDAMVVRPKEIFNVLVTF